jgi:ribosomal protein S25
MGAKKPQIETQKKWMWEYKRSAKEWKKWHDRHRKGMKREWMIVGKDRIETIGIEKGKNDCIGKTCINIHVKHSIKSREPLSSKLMIKTYVESVLPIQS